MNEGISLVHIAPWQLKDHPMERIVIISFTPTLTPYQLSRHYIATALKSQGKLSAWILRI